MNMNRELAITTIMILLSSVQLAQAGDHGVHADMVPVQAAMGQDIGRSHQGQQRTHDQEKKIPQDVESPHMEGMKGFLFKQATVDGYLLTFHIMKADNHELVSCAYRLMFKAEQDGRPVKNLIVNSSVAHPNDQSESKMMMQTGDWYAAAYDLMHPGEHELKVLFKAKDGRMHAASVTYFVEKVQE